MALGNNSKVLVVQLANADATVLAASATVKRFLRGYKAVNGTAGTVSFSLAIAAGFTAATAIENARPVTGTAATENSISEYLPGDGHPFVNTAVRAFASAATSITLHLYYDEYDIT